MALTPKQQRFVEEYLKDLNATQAAIRAGYSAKTARSVGAENLTKPDVQAAVEAGRKAQSQRCQIDADYVLTRLKLEAERQDEDASHSARVAALNLLGKHLGMFVDKLEVKEPVQLQIVRKVVHANGDTRSGTASGPG